MTASAGPTEPRRAERDIELAEAIRLRERGDRESREAARQRLLALSRQWPDDAEVAYQTAWAHDVLEREAEAVPHYRRALAGDGFAAADRCEALLGLGSTLRVLGRYEEAEATLREAVAAFPDHGGLRTFWAMALYNTGRYEESVRLLLELLATTSEDPTVREFGRAIAYYAADLGRTLD
ncbi:tetratricopeptide repeat protein [Streptomyces sp. NPDC020412]|uniref:tetratricopeptide repeat protein n=1 Tax=Streptomyces sp. NPDC020412 TaxID=3365073 RepID=UPI0037A40814